MPLPLLVLFVYITSLMPPRLALSMYCNDKTYYTCTYFVILQVGNIVEARADSCRTVLLLLLVAIVYVTQVVLYFGELRIRTAFLQSRGVLSRAERIRPVTPLALSWHQCILLLPLVLRLYVVELEFIFLLFGDRPPGAALPGPGGPGVMPTSYEKG